jgi:hypothetical protein
MPRQEPLPAGIHCVGKSACGGRRRDESHTFMLIHFWDRTLKRYHLALGEFSGFESFLILGEFRRVLVSDSQRESVGKSGS